MFFLFYHNNLKGFNKKTRKLADFLICLSDNQFKIYGITIYMIYNQSFKY